MNFQTCVTLGLLAAVLVVPRTALSQDVCNGQPDGPAGMLGQLGNLMGNLLNGLGPLQPLGLTNRNDLMDLQGIMQQVQNMLTNLLNELHLGSLNWPEQTGMIADNVRRLADMLNNKLGGNQGDQMRCATPTSSPGGPTEMLIGLGNLINGGNSGLSGLINGLLRLVATLLGVLTGGLL